MEFWVILVAFRQWKNGQKWKKTLYIARFCRVFGCQSIENTAKTSVLDWRYSKKRVNYRMLDWKHYKNTVKSNVLEGFTAFMAKNVYITVCLTGNIGKTLSKTMFWKDFLYICWSWLPALEHGKIEENTVNRGIFNVGEIRELEALSNMMFSTGFMVTKV